MKTSGGRGCAAGVPERIKHQTHSAAPLTIIKMPRLKGDIPNLRLFVSIKCIPGLPPPSQEQCIKEVGVEGKWKFYPFY